MKQIGERVDLKESAGKMGKEQAVSYSGLVIQWNLFEMRMFVSVRFPMETIQWIKGLVRVFERLIVDMCSITIMMWYIGSFMGERVPGKGGNSKYVTDFTVSKAIIRMTKYGQYDHIWSKIKILSEKPQ